MPDPWTFHGSVIWVLIIGVVLVTFAISIGEAGKWLGL